MKVTISKITTTEVEVEIPTECPGCGQDFTDPDVYGLTLDQYVAGQQGATMSEDGTEIEDYSSDDICNDGDIVVGYRCGKCGRVLASTENADPPVEAAL